MRGPAERKAPTGMAGSNIPSGGSFRGRFQPPPFLPAPSLPALTPNPSTSACARRGLFHYRSGRATGVVFATPRNTPYLTLRAKSLYLRLCYSYALYSDSPTFPSPPRACVFPRDYRALPRTPLSARGCEREDDVIDFDTGASRRETIGKGRLSGGEGKRM